MIFLTSRIHGTAGRLVINFDEQTFKIYEDAIAAIVRQTA